MIITAKQMVEEIGLPVSKVCPDAMDAQTLRNRVSMGGFVARLADGTYVTVNRNAKIYGKPAEQSV